MARYETRQIPGLDLWVTYDTSDASDHGIPWSSREGAEAQTAAWNLNPDQHRSERPAREPGHYAK
jgi:hypothetical protein